jgi:hypothetical protein
MNPETVESLYEHDNTIKAEDELFDLLKSHVRRGGSKRRYPKAVADFADEVFGALVAHRDLDELRRPDEDHGSSLARLLHHVSDEEMRVHHWELVELAARVYETGGSDLEDANRVLIDILGLGSRYLLQSVETSDPSNTIVVYLVSTELFETKFGQKVRIRQRGIYRQFRTLEAQEAASETEPVKR